MPAIRTWVEVREEQFEHRYGRLRGASRRAAEKFLDCGILEPNSD